MHPIAFVSSHTNFENNIFSCLSIYIFYEDRAQSDSLYKGYFRVPTLVYRSISACGLEINISKDDAILQEVIFLPNAIRVGLCCNRNEYSHSTEDKKMKRKSRTNETHEAFDPVSLRIRGTRDLGLFWGFVRVRESVRGRWNPPKGQ